MGGRGTESIARGTVLDPMRQVDEALDYEGEYEQVTADYEREILDASQVVDGIRRESTDEAADVVGMHYLDRAGWPEIAREMGHTETECQALLEITLDWADSVGVARLREIGRGNRSGKSLREIAGEIAGEKSPGKSSEKSSRGNRA